VSSGAFEQHTLRSGRVITKAVPVAAVPH